MTKASAVSSVGYQTASAVTKGPEGIVLKRLREWDRLCDGKPHGVHPEDQLADHALPPSRRRLA